MGPAQTLLRPDPRPASAWPGHVPRATLVNFSLGQGRCQEHRLGSADCRNGGPPRPISSGSAGPPGQSWLVGRPNTLGRQHRRRARLHTQSWVNVGVARARILQNRPPIGVRFFAHTADLGIEVWAPSLESCFARAAAGMFASFIALGPRNGAEQSVRVEVSADGVEELMVSWLEELLFESEVKGIALHSFEVQSVAASHAVGLAQGAAFGPASTQVGPVIKAVTRHGLEVRRAGRHWRARIIFDV